MNDDAHVVLCVDDEENILRSLKRLLRREGYELLTASSGKEGLSLMMENDVHLVISDQRMPEMTGTEFLARVKEGYPDVIRICLTGYADVDSITESINKGHIYKFFFKPWNDQSLKLEIRQALDQYDLIKTNKDLHNKVVEQNEILRNMNESLELLVQKRTEELENRNQALEFSHTVLENLPISIVGVSAEGRIVLINHNSESLPFTRKPIKVGKNISDYFPNDLVAHLESSLTSMVPQAVENYELSGNQYAIEFIPLPGRFQGKGVLVTNYLSEYGSGCTVGRIRNIGEPSAVQAVGAEFGSRDAGDQ